MSITASIERKAIRQIKWRDRVLVIIAVITATMLMVTAAGTYDVANQTRANARSAEAQREQLTAYAQDELKLSQELASLLGQSAADQETGAQVVQRIEDQLSAIEAKLALPPSPAAVYAPTTSRVPTTTLPLTTTTEPSTNAAEPSTNAARACRIELLNVCLLP